MFWQEHGRYILVFLLAVVLLLVTIFLIFRPMPNVAGETSDNEVNLLEYVDSDASMILRAQGPIVAQSNQQSLKISVDRQNVVFELDGSYGNETIASARYTNNSGAFADFVSALDRLGYTNGIDDSEYNSDLGYCPRGVRYSFAIIDNGTEKQKYWHSSCGNGNFKGSYSQIINLFKKQIPNNSDVFNKINFSF